MDVVLKDIPDGISEHDVKEWVSVLVERYHNSKINQIPEVKKAQDTAKTEIDTYRKAVGLKAKFETTLDSKEG